jgi:hypothetical protein
MGLYLIASGLLVIAGAQKTAKPDDTARALSILLPARLARLRLVRAAVRSGALAELALGVVALTFPRPVTALLVALSYLGFAGVVALVRSRGGALASCGCFGKPDTPATPLHLIINLVLGISAAVAGSGASTSGWLLTQLAHQPLHGGPLLAVSGVGLFLTYLALSVMASLGAARQLSGATWRPKR